MECCLYIYSHYCVLASGRVHKRHKSKVLRIPIVIFSISCILELESLTVLYVNKIEEVLEIGLFTSGHVGTSHDGGAYLREVLRLHPLELTEEGGGGHFIEAQLGDLLDEGRFLRGCEDLLDFIVGLVHDVEHLVEGLSQVGDSWGLLEIHKVVCEGWGCLRASHSKSGTKKDKK
jgi:hypothetical protein